MATDITGAVSEEVAASLRTAQLEQAYERALRQAERIYEEERQRALRVQLLLLEDENDDLHDQAIEVEKDLNNLEEDNSILRHDVEILETDLQQAHVELKKRSRDADTYKAEVGALNMANSDTNRIVAEKISLARELSVLKPELEHLRSQVNTQQNLLAEKLSLQRELSTIQVELETEKRTVNRIKSQDKTQIDSESTLRTELEELRKELAKAQRESQRKDRESQKKTIEWENQKEVLDGKLDAFRNKLRTTKEQLKDAQDELEKAQAVKFAKSAEMTKARLAGANANTNSTINPKKRNVARFDPDMTIGTPGNGAAAKRQKLSAVVGDKSSFSITPFLNRTLSVLPESPDDKDEDTNKNEAVAESVQPIAVPLDNETPSSPSNNQHSAKPKTNTTKPGPRALKETTSNPRRKAVNSKRSEPLPKVTEEAEEDQENDEIIVEKPELADKPTEEPKKQKMLTTRTNIFDEEDAAPVKTRTLIGGGLRGGGAAMGRINLSGFGKKGGGKTLAEFSPLKKDRRAAVAT